MKKHPMNSKVIKGKKAKGHLARKSFERKIFKLESWSPGAGVFPIKTINWLSLKRRRDSDFETFCYYEKREINTFENFPCEFFLARLPCAGKKGSLLWLIHSDIIKHLHWHLMSIFFFLNNFLPWIYFFFLCILK